MRIVQQSAVVEQCPASEEVLKAIELAARTCYQSEPVGDSGAFVRRLVKSGHLSQIEHVSATVRFVTDRGVSHELVRHRLASYSQESTRYCRYGEEITVIQPPGLLGPHGEQEDLWRAWRDSVLLAERSYAQMLAWGVTPQIARSVLPSCTKTELVMTANLREWRHLFSLRCARTAHPQMKELASMALRELRGRVPVALDAIELSDGQTI